MPIILYGCETWILSEPHLHTLESFQADIGKRILGISKYHSNTGTLIGLHWPSVKARILTHKLTFLAKLLERDDCLSFRVFRTLVSEDVYEISLVQQCRFLEQQYGPSYLQLCLENPSQACSIVHDAKEGIFEKDWICTLQDSRSHSSLAVVSATDGIASGWNSILDEALKYGVWGTRLMQGLFWSTSQTDFGRQSMPSL